MQKLLAAGIMSAALVTQAFAIAPEEYWVAQDANTKHCSIVTEKPMSPANIVGSTAFKSRSQAENAMKTSKMCASE